MSGEDRKRVRCRFCSLVQFVRTKETCLKCKASYSVALFVVKAVVEETPPMEKFNFWLGVIVNYLRVKAEFSQTDLAFDIGSKKHYISRLENGFVSPGVRKLDQIASALGTDVSKVCMMTEFMVLEPKC